MAAYGLQDIPPQTGRIAVVTGANTGIGYEAARGLALKGAHVILACRNPEKGQAAVARIQAEKPAGSVEVKTLDLSDLDSVHRFAQDFTSSHARLDLLVNNAGVMIPPFGKTTQGFELQFGTNHLGHFALTGHLLPLLSRTEGSRVVVVYSAVYRQGRIHFEDPNFTRRPYNAWGAYSQSKLATLLFALELQRRLPAGGAPMVTAAHPGWTATELQRESGFIRFFNPLLAMSPAEGALPTLRAATDPQAGPASVWGPAGWFELKGAPAPAHLLPHAHDTEVAARLWTLSETLTGVTFGIPSVMTSRTATA